MFLVKFVAFSFLVRICWFTAIVNTSNGNSDKKKCEFILNDLNSQNGIDQNLFFRNEKRILGSEGVK